MNSAIIQLLVLAGIAIFLIMRLRNTLGTRGGFEKPAEDTPKIQTKAPPRPGLSVIEGGIDRDIADHTDIKGKSGQALADMKKAEPGFSLHEFLSGAKGAYEMILTAFENGDKDTLRKFLADDVYRSFTSVIETREAEGLHIDATIIGIGEVKLTSATFDAASRLGDITVKFMAELTSVVRNTDDEIVEGNPQEIKRQKDVWTFARTMGSDDPNWQLVATAG